MSAKLIQSLSFYREVILRACDDVPQKKHCKNVLLILFSAGAVVVVCCLGCCLGLAVTSGNGFKIDAFSPCFRSMSLSEDKTAGEEFSSSPSLSDSQSHTVAIHLLWPSSPSNSVAFSWLLKDQRLIVE